MSKIDDAKIVLSSLGLPKKQQNDRSALTLLALADIKRNSSWKNARNVSLRIHDIMNFIERYYHLRYAENSRETIRRQTLHQFIQAGIVLKNPDAPKRATNSPNTVYCLSPLALRVIQVYKSGEWEEAVKFFLKEVGTLTEKYRKQRDINKIPIMIRDREFKLSPGIHNLLQKQIYEDFGSRFAPGSILIYMGDTAKKQLYLDEEYCRELNLDISQYDKLPDVVLYDSDKNWLYLIEAVTSHGPISEKRVIEINEMLYESSAKKIFVTAFPDFKTFLKYASEIAWETEIWISDNPDHMIHYNGDKFLRSID